MNGEQNPIPLEVEGVSPKRRFCLKCAVGTLAILAVTIAILWFALSARAPDKFPSGIVIEIPYGSSVGEIARTLLERDLIRSPLAFTLLARLSGVDTTIAAGTYRFEEPLTLFALLEKLSSARHDIERLRITIPEGTSVAGMGRAFAVVLPEFDAAEFEELAKTKEGYLFPDTYFFFSNATSGPVIGELESTFRTKTDALKGEAVVTGKNWSDIIIMASIIEEEAAKPEDRRIVSGILWKRMEKRMALGVDAPFAYALGKNSATLTTDDLQNFDSPYNTYRYLGLPPTPITNPGLDAIDAALHPEASPYYYYLSDKSGTIYYAKTFEEHKRNKEKYLR